MSNRSYIVVVALCILFIFIAVDSKKDISSIPSMPDANIYIKDNANIISDEVEKNMNNKLIQLNKNTEMSLYIVTLNGLSNTSTALFAGEILNRWYLFGNKKTTLLLILPDGKSAAAVSSMGIFYETNQTLQNSISYYFKNYGNEAGAKYAFNTITSRICSSLNSTDIYSFNDISVYKKDYFLNFAILISFVGAAIAFMFFYTDILRLNTTKNNKNFKLSKIEILSKLKKHLLLISSSALCIISFALIYGLYMSDAGKLKDFIIMLIFFSVFVFPILEDIYYTLLDLTNPQFIKFEGVVHKTYWNFTKYCFIIENPNGEMIALSSNSQLVKVNNYVSVCCTKNLKYTTELNIEYDRIVVR